MKILQIIGVLNRGGAETLLMNIFNNIDRKKFKFDFLVFQNKHFDYEDKIRELGGNIIFIESPKEIGMINFIRKLKKLCKQNKYDVVHAHTLFNCGPCVLAAWLAGIKKRISHSHSTKILENEITVKKKIYFFMSKLLINLLSTDCIACGEKAGKFLYYRFRKFKIIKNGIDIDKFKYNEKNNIEIRKKYNIPDSSLIIGNVGRLIYIKNQKYLIDIFSKINKQHSDSYLLILGDGELKEELQNKIKKLNLEKNVFLTGSVENANEYYSAFDVFALPSLFEGVPFTLIEAQTNGLPIIASENISKECNISNTIKFLNIEEKNVSKWVNEIINIYNGMNSRNDNIKFIIKEGYSIKETIKVLNEIYCKKK